MKKLLILMLVLGITSVANAAFTLVVDGADVGDAMDLGPGGLVMIGIHNDTAGAGGDTKQFIGYVIINDVTRAEWTGINNVYMPPAVPGSVNSDYGVGDHLGTGLVDVFEGNYTNPGIYYSGVGVLGDFQYQCNADDGVAVLVQLMDGTTGGIIDSLSITQIPEPMTIALLGLGGLFLLRRRK